MERCTVRYRTGRVQVGIPKGKSVFSPSSIANSSRHLIRLNRTQSGKIRAVTTHLRGYEASTIGNELEQDVAYQWLIFLNLRPRH